MDELTDPVTGMLTVDTNSREYRRVRRRQWLASMRRYGYKRVDVFLSQEGYQRMLELMEYGEGPSATIERCLMDYEA